jgi:flagellar basal body-associated protein FliL
MTGMIGGKTDPNANKRYVVPPVEMSEPFTANTNDPSGDVYLAMSLALQLEPMKKEAWDHYSGAGAKGHGAGDGEMPGAVKVASYPKFRDAVIETVGHFSAKQLRSEAGKDQLKQDLLEAFEKIYQVDEAEAKAAPEDPAELGLAPPYKVKAITLTNYAVQ